MKVALRALALALTIISISSVASAQDRAESEEPGDSARFRWGPLRFTPSIVVTNVGVDDNVFNDPNHKVGDTTAAVGPGIALWTKLGPIGVTGKSSAQYLYFKEFENQRSWNTANELMLELPRAHIRPFASGSYVNSRQRPGFEIDSRARASTNTVTLGTDLRFSGKTTLVLGVSRMTTAFDQEETFLGSVLAEALNRHTDSEQVQLQYKLTPLTTFVLTTEAIQERFDEDRIKNSDSIRVRPGFEFKPFALISGRASIGFRRFNVLNESIEDYQGIVASVDAKYMLGVSTLFVARVDRDISYSFEDLYPYYSLTDSSLTITQHVARSWDVVASGALQSLAYRAFKSTIDTPDRTDKGRVLGLGVGYRVGETLRLGFDVIYYSRRSPQPDRNYDGLRAGASVGYGSQP